MEKLKSQEEEFFDKRELKINIGCILGIIFSPLFWYFIGTIIDNGWGVAVCILSFIGSVICLIWLRYYLITGENLYE